MHTFDGALQSLAQCRQQAKRLPYCVYALAAGQSLKWGMIGVVGLVTKKWPPHSTASFLSIVIL